MGDEDKFEAEEMMKADHLQIAFGTIGYLTIFSSL